MTDKNKRQFQKEPKVVDENAPAPIVPVWQEVVAQEFLAVRTAPSVTADVLVYLTRNKKYMVEISGKPWLKIKHNALGDRIGYVSATILKDQPVK